MLSNVLFILLGAGLVLIGFLGAALAARLRVPRETEPSVVQGSRETEPHTSVVHGPSVLPVVSVIKLTAASPVVVAALVAAGYKQSFAAKATWACSAAERLTVESWTAAALRRCGRGGLP